MILLAAKALLTLFVVMDPVGLAPVFVGLTGGRSPEEQRRTARRAVVVAGGVLFSFALFGPALLEYLGISLDAFRVAGGLLLFKIAVDMVFAHRERETDEEKAEASLREDISVFPLAIPLLAGPGAMTSVMILTAEARSVPGGLFVVLGAVVVVLLAAYVALALSGHLARLLGRTGVNVVTRVLGVLLSALAVQYVADGVVDFLKQGLG
ncbi:MarC family protein [Oceanithermus sp.]|uniref:MarC family protein n=1 Tax=Oceanithermus sp. TaxID=2268145 RepID=UPI0025FA2177|nr:MarC family protein [Oceanithermus sp.]